MSNGWWEKCLPMKSDENTQGTKKKFIVHPPLNQHVVEDHYIVFATPRKLPFANQLIGKVVVLDIAFAHSLAGKNQPSITHDLIKHLGKRLMIWVDHHDSEFHAEFAGDSRFILTTKAEHGACPELLTPALVQKHPKADTIVCHSDFDGLVSCAKWILNGEEPYPNADQDAWAVDTRMGQPSEIGQLFDLALKGKRDENFFKTCLELLVKKLDPSLVSHWHMLESAAKEGQMLEDQAKALVQHFVPLCDQVVFLDLSSTGLQNQKDFDRTTLLLMGQDLAKIAILKDHQTVTFSTAFDSGINFLQIFNISSGMPTVLSLKAKEWERCWDLLRAYLGL
jgi:hypothetical protein